MKTPKAVGYACMFPEYTENPRMDSIGLVQVYNEHASLYKNFSYASSPGGLLDNKEDDCERIIRHYRIYDC
jgi:hypothetical protein